jgi:hypothetical protein
MPRYLIKYSEPSQGKLTQVKYKRNFSNHQAAKDWAELNLEAGTWVILPYDHEYSPADRDTLGRRAD